MCFPFSWGKRETHKQNSQEISGKGRESPGTVPGQSREIFVSLPYEGGPIGAMPRFFALGLQGSMWIDSPPSSLGLLSQSEEHTSNETKKFSKE